MENSHFVILVVDDNPANLGLLFDALDEVGFEVLVSQNGESAIKRARSNLPDLILLDVMMPGIDGFETCKQLKADEATREIPVIFMTALAEIEEKVKGFRYGAVDYITKPIQPAEVLARIKTHLTIQSLQRDLRQKNRELSAALEREQELNRLKSRFVSMISHEFKTPLTTILLSNNLLQRYGDRMSPEKRREELAAVERAVARLNEMLEGVLTLSRGEAGKIPFQPAMTAVTQLCRNLAVHFRATCEATHTITFAAASDDLQAVADPKLLEQILSNLLSNAIKYSPAGGNIRFELTSAHHALEFRVQDAGLGISAADQQHLFEAFHRGENVGTIKGTGLGLSIVKQFVELHGGRIDASSTLGQGSTFTVIIPVQERGNLTK